MFRSFFSLFTARSPSRSNLTFPSVLPSSLACTNTVSVSFVFGGTPYALTSADMSRGLYETGSSFCVGAISASDLGSNAPMSWIIGAAFLKNVYSGTIESLSLQREREPKADRSIPFFRLVSVTSLPSHPSLHRIRSSL